MILFDAIRLAGYAADNRIPERARTGKADVIVTGDKAMPELGGYRHIDIISLRDYFELA